MTADNRTNEPTETQVKLAYLAHLKAPRTRGMDVYGPMRAALTAAGVAPQEPSSKMFSPSECPNADHPEMESCGLCDYRPAPQELCPQPCEHLSAEDAREGRDCREHPCTCPTAPSSDREKLIEEARAVAGPKSLYAHTSVAHLLIRLADALTAAGVAPQAATGVGELAELPTETPASWSVGLDPEKVAEVALDPEKVALLIEQMRDRSRKERDVAKESLGQFIARALCAAYTEGKLT